MRDTSGAGSSGAGVRARVTDQVYYGPDTVIKFALESDPSTTVKTRTFAHDAPAEGELVDLVVRGPVVVYPPAAQASETRRRRRDPNPVKEPSMSGLRALTTVLAAAALASFGSGCAGGGANSLLLYNGQHPQLTHELVAAFEKQTGIDVRVRTGDGIVLADQLLQEGKYSPADVYLTENSPELVTLDEHGLLASTDSSVLDESTKHGGAGNWTGVALRISALAYNPSLAAKSELPSSILKLRSHGGAGRSR